ncbi:DNA-binding response regulator, OmpR family, contains REC and winged-helix (wHTH) domain [Lactonifactor longoviformis DSM 17459]|uniref:Stage 0 sporulation protein A homolog n=2 Tax=Lactonifactor TaxID=420345 RepID=A0A1M4T5X4_9CLOT|nr:DNA-binding response regulator, OmpR family, contains REC and winged-helix (wHTH) domain [Lactonifactor longoviformis DSM 17459]
MDTNDTGEKKMIKILIVEDEEPISNLIRINLTKAGYLCDCAFDGLEAADQMAEGGYDLILLDIMLPKIDGYELLEYAKTLDLPVIFITAMGTLNHKVKGLRQGADDYITKPFEIVELLARVESTLRRYHKTQKIIRILDVEIDVPSRIVRQNKEQVLLTLKEFELLLLFVRNKNVALYRETIYENVWESSYLGDSRTVDLHVQRLRKKLGWEKHIVSVYKVGYRLEA